MAKESVIRVSQDVRENLEKIKEEYDCDFNTALVIAIRRKAGTVRRLNRIEERVRALEIAVFKDEKDA